jgi:hypothetical protein
VKREEDAGVGGEQLPERGARDGEANGGARRTAASLARNGQQRVEPLWSPVVATRGNQRQTGRRRKRPKQAKTVAVGCQPLPPRFHGKEGVSGSSPEEGSVKAPHVGAFVSTSTCRFSRVRWVWSRLWSFQEDAVKAASEAASYELTQSHRHGLMCAPMSPNGGGNVGWVRLVSCGVK